MIWGYYISPMMYGQNAIAINEFLDDRWSTVSSFKGHKNSRFAVNFYHIIWFSSYLNIYDHCIFKIHIYYMLDIILISMVQPTPPNSSQPTVGKTLLKERGLFTDEYWYWICIAALLGFSLLFNFLFIGALTFLNSK